MNHQRHVGGSGSFERLVERFQAVPLSHPNFHPDRHVGVFLQDGYSFFGASIAQVLQFTRKGGWNTPRRDVDKSEHSYLRSRNTIAAEISEVHEACRAGVHDSASPVRQTKVWVYSEGAAFIPVTVEIDQTRTQVEPVKIRDC